MPAGSSETSRPDAKPATRVVTAVIRRPSALPWDAEEEPGVTVVLPLPETSALPVAVVPLASGQEIVPFESAVHWVVDKALARACSAFCSCSLAVCLAWATFLALLAFASSDLARACCARCCARACRRTASCLASSAARTFFAFAGLYGRAATAILRSLGALPAEAGSPCGTEVAAGRGGTGAADASLAET
jgi:hypothetical protein